MDYTILRCTTLKMIRFSIHLDKLFKEEEKIKTYQIALGPAIGWAKEGLESMKRKNVTAVQTVFNILEQTPGNELIKFRYRK